MISILGNTEIGDPFERNAIGAIKVLSTVAKLRDHASIMDMPSFNDRAMDAANDDRIAFSINVELEKGNMPELVKTYSEVWIKNSAGEIEPLTWIGGIVKTTKGMSAGEYIVPMSMHAGWAALSRGEVSFLLRNVRIADVETSITLAKLPEISLDNHEHAREKISRYNKTNLRMKANSTQLLITDEMLFGKRRYAPTVKNKADVNTAMVDASNHQILLVHGMGDNPMWRISDFNYNSGNDGPSALHFDDRGNGQLRLATGKCTSNFQFARSLNNFINTRMDDADSVSIVAHSQGGLAALTLYDDYLDSRIRIPFAPRPIQTIGTPFNGTVSAMMGMMGETLGISCAAHPDLMPVFATLNLAYISAASKKAVYFKRTAGGKYLGCSPLSGVLVGRDDGVVSVAEGNLRGGNSTGVTDRLCHMPRMTYAIQYNNSQFNKAMYRWSYPSYDVGVIKEGSCGDMEQVSLRMDDEDSRNANRSRGWVGATGLGSNTTWVACRVKNGAMFKPLTTSDVRRHYALLKLGSECPVGSLPFSRRFDNEDRNNRNRFSGDIFPNTSKGNTTMNFCYFGNARDGSGTMSAFPDLGVPYGVYGASNFALRRATGYRKTDDEDKNNRNRFSYAPGVSSKNVNRMIYGGRNTVVRMVKVR